MNIKKIGIIAGSILAGLYVLFLAVPFFLNGFVNSYNDEIAKAVEEACGFKLKLEKIRLVTTPKLTVGLRVGEFAVFQPDGDEILNVSNAAAKMSLLPLLVKRIEADVVSADSINGVFKVQKDGRFLVENYIPEAAPADKEAPVASELPYGFKLSNHLPDIRVKNYSFALVDMRNSKKYAITGKDFNITDFIFNKHVKISTEGSVSLDDTVPFNYNVKVFNRIMPDTDLNKFVFAQEQTENQTVEQMPIAFNVIDIFEGIRKNQLSADLSANIKTDVTIDNININGLIDLEKLTLAVNSKKLPEGHVKLNFKGKKLISDIALYTAENELTNILGDMDGKSKKINITFKSNAQINNIFNIVKSIADTFNYKELRTLTATGGIDADFTLKSNMRKISSDGYFKIPSASVKYGLYNILIDKINADVDFAGDRLNINNIAFEILSQPLKLFGTIKSDTETDLHLTADRLSIKGLIVAVGQAALLKENDIKSGTLTVDASVKGKFKELIPRADVLIDNINILNKPSTLALKLPKSKITVDSKDVNIDNTYVLLDNSRIDINGKISDYAAKNISINLKAAGNLVADDLKSLCPADIRSMIKAKGSMPLALTVTGNDKKQMVDFQMIATPSGYFNIADVSALNGKSTLISSRIVVADNSMRFEDSGLYSANASALPVSLGSASPLVKLKGSMDNLTNPHFNNLNISTTSAQTISMPLLELSKLVANANVTLNGNIATPSMKGSFSVPEFKMGGLAATNLTSDCGFKDNVFSLKNLKGDAFSGKINGDIAVNVISGKTSVKMNGSGMNAVTAIEGAAGIPNALSGTLGFNADLKLNSFAPSYNAMLNSILGDISFDVKDGHYANIGRLDNLLLAQNLAANAILKAALAPVRNLPVIQNASAFSSITGALSLKNGVADLKSVKSVGPSVSYFVTGNYNLVSGYTNVVVLGRLGADVVAALGPLGQLSVNKLTSFIPKFGAQTATLVNTLTSNPNAENTAQIPALTSGSTNTKDFKVVFTGNVTSPASIKSFKWLTTCDISGISGGSLKEQLKTNTETLKNSGKTTVQDVKNSVENVKETAKNTAGDIKNQVQKTKDSIQDLKNLKNMFKTPVSEK